ncbi:hypothetical protein H1R20_g307, partial [Candolleomyces eurysporus]
MVTLLAHCIPEALYDSHLITSIGSSMHPKTRVGVLNALEKWILAPRTELSSSSGINASSKPLLWFSGPLGYGKTTILRELAKRCTKNNQLLASYFFSTHSPHSTDGARYFVPTLAYQIASNVPGLWDFVESAVQEDPKIFERSAEDQMLGLVFQPLERCLRYSTRYRYWWTRLKASIISSTQSREHWSNKLEQSTAFRKLYNEWWNRNIIVVDGLDECIGMEEQRQVIGLMAWAGKHRKFPLRFVASGPAETRNIAESFDVARRSKVVVNIALDAYADEGDLKAYLEDEFARIRRTRSINESALDWPGKQVVELLVKKAHRRFVYLATFIAFVDDPNGNSVELLDWLISSIPPQNTADDTKPTAELDALYTAILHYHPGHIPAGTILDLRKTILHSLIFSGRDFGSMDEIDEYLSVKPGLVTEALQHLHSVMLVPPDLSISIEASANAPDVPVTRPWQKIWFRHKSMWDFLVSQERSGDMHQFVPREKMSGIQRLLVSKGMEAIPDSRFWAVPSTS